MWFAQFVALTSVSALLLQAVQCREKEEAFQSLQQSVRERAGKTVRWEKDEAARDATLQQVRTLRAVAQLKRIWEHHQIAFRSKWMAFSGARTQEEGLAVL